MDLPKVVEELRKTCILRNEVEEKEIVIRPMDLSRYTPGYISVKDIPAEIFNSISEASSSSSFFDVDPLPAIEDVNQASKSQERPVPASQEFLKENEIPELPGKVYDFVMSKDKTMPKSFFSPEQVASLKRKWICVGTLFISTVVLIILVIVVVVVTSGSN